jgi:hypothetical protein
MATYHCAAGYKYYNHGCHRVRSSGHGNSASAPAQSPGYGNPVSGAVSGMQSGGSKGAASAGPVGAVVGGALGTAGGAATGAVRAGYSWDGTLTGEKGGAISANREKNPRIGWQELTIRHPRSAHAAG